VAASLNEKIADNVIIQLCCFFDETFPMLRLMPPSFNNCFGWPWQGLVENAKEV